MRLLKEGKVFVVDRATPKVAGFIRSSVLYPNRVFDNGQWVLYRVQDAVAVAKIMIQETPDLDLSAIPSVFHQDIMFYRTSDGGKASLSPYEVLFLTPEAPDFIVDKVFRELAKRFHPDRPDGNSEKFKEVNDAYQSIKKERNL